MQQGKGRFLSPVPSRAGTTGTRYQWVQTPGATRASAKPHPISEGLAAGAPGQLGCSVAATWEQVGGTGAEELCDMSWERFHQELIHSFGSCLCSSPLPRPLPEWCCSYVWTWPCALLGPTCWFEFWLHCGPISSYRHVWRPGLLQTLATSSTHLVLHCLASPVGNLAPGWSSHFGSSPMYSLQQDPTAILCLKQGMQHFRVDSKII